MRICLLPVFCSLALSAVPLAAQMEMPKPGPEHQRLAKEVGTWDAVIDSVADGKPEKSKGETETRPMGGFWFVDSFAGSFAGMPFQGHGIIGYDPIKKKYVQSWVDSMSPILMMFEGSFDKDGKVLTMTGTGPSAGGKSVAMRTVTTWKDDNTKVFELFETGPDGKEMKMVTINYTRRTKAAENAGAKK
jgi:hypothetical protein